MPRLLRIAAISRAYTRQFFLARPELLHGTYSDMKAALEEDGASSAPAYSAAFSRLGYECGDIFPNVTPLQRRWASERGIAITESTEIAVRQAIEFRPEILWFDSPDGELMRRLRAALPSLRLAVGWEGSALSSGAAWSYLDMVLSCAPESVGKLRRVGLRSEHLHHGFDTSITARLGVSSERLAISFAGSLIRRAQYHVRRDALLARLSGVAPLQIFTPSASPREYCKMFASGVLHAAMSLAERLGLDINRWPHVLRRSASPFRRPINPSLRKFCRPPVFGLAYFQTVRDSRVSLNIHADSSPHYASNMRMFEVTGAGSCLLTDYKPNLASLFDPDSEVIAYRSDEECLEKAKWLLDHPRECKQIAARGYRRTLAQHTVEHRAAELHQLFGRAIG